MSPAGPSHECMRKRTCEVPARGKSKSGSPPIHVMATDKHEYDTIYRFLARHEYPTGYSKNEKRALRRKATSYKVENSALFYMTKKGSAEWKQAPQSAEERDRILDTCHSLPEGSYVTCN